MKREIFKNAPLVEMIAEVRWQLTPVSVVPNGAIDPFHDVIKAALKERMPSCGYPHIREKIPPEVPREFLGGQVTTQFYKGANMWPLFQLGPGIFTVNITEDYQGWMSFRDVVSEGIGHLLAVHPASSLFHLQSLKLMAIDAFSEQHGFRSYSEFSQKYLKLSSPLGTGFLQEFSKDMDAVNVRSDTEFPLSSPLDSRAQISISAGKRNNKNALILQTAIESGASISSGLGHPEIMGWFDAAHGVHRTMFRSLLTKELLANLQPEALDDKR